MFDFSKRLILLIALGMFVAVAWHSAQAQDRGERRGFGGDRRGGFGGGRGGFGGGGGGLLGMLGREEVRSEINLTPEQTEKIEALQEKSSEQRQELFSSLRDADPDADRQAMFEKMRAEGEKLQAAATAELKTVLTPEQYTRVEQLRWHEQGGRALEQEEIAEKLKLTAEQRSQISALVEEANQSRRGGFGRGRRGDRGEGGGDQNEDRPSREEQQAELDQKLLAVLNTDQQKQWDQILGPPPVEIAAESGNDRSRERGRGERRNRRDRNEAAPSFETNSAEGGQVVAELSGPATSEGAGETTETVAAAEAEGLLSFNFRFAPWELVLKRFAEEANLNLQMDVVPPGTLNYYDKGEYTPTQALDVLNGYLLQKGYLLIKRDRFLVVVNIDDGVPPNLVPQVSIEDLQSEDTIGKNQLVSIVISLQGAEAGAVSEEVKAMLGPQGKVAPLANLNQLVITDTGGNLRRIYRLLTGETDGPPKSLKFRAFPLKYITAIDADRIVRDLFGMPARGAANNVSSSGASNSNEDRFSRFRSFRDRDRGGDDRRESSRTPPAPAATSGSIRLAIDERTNSLLVTASADNLRMIEEALKTIDVGEGPGGVQIAGGGMNRPQLEVYQVQSADPREVTKTLDTLLPGVVVNEDGRARRIHILATPDEHRQIRAIINQLDGAAGGQGVTVVHLNQLDPLAAAGTLRSLFGEDSSDAPTIEPDLAGRRLLIRGSTEQLSQIKALLSQLGEDGTRQANAESQERGPIRTIPLGGRDGKELIQLLQQVWGASNKNPIRIVIPSAIGPALRSEKQENERREEVVPSPTKPLEVEPAVLRRTSPDKRPSVEKVLELDDLEADEALEAEESAASDSNDAKRFEEFAANIGDEVPAERQNAGTGSESELSRRGAPIVIAPDGGKLIIASEDEEALNRIENLIAALARATPRKRQWTVFYLRSSDALETASTLGELFPSGSVAAPTMASSSGLSGSISSLGSSLMDMSGLSSLSAGSESLRIIPEPRLNALFVAGPESQIEEIENVLKILDGGELPESLRERIPRRIELEYTDVNEVAAIIRDVYQDYLEKPERNNGGRGGGNPLAMMMGGSSGQAASVPGKDVKMTLGVDTQTNALIVSANESLFQQVSAMVESIEQAASDAKRTVRVVQVDRATAPLIQQSLGSLFGKITVSTTSGGTQPAASRSNSNGSSSGDASSSDENRRRDEIRQFFEQRMRDRSGRDGGGSESRFSGRRDRSEGGGGGRESSGRRGRGQR